MNSNLIFTPVQGTESKIARIKNQPGWLYFATDTGRIYLDTENDERVILGGSGAAIYYGNAAAIEEIDGEPPMFVYPIDNVQQTGVPKINDIILDENNGTFYRIVDITNTYFLCQRMFISGTGGGGSTGTLRPSLVILDENLPSNIINGQNFSIRIKANAAKDSEGNYIPSSLVLHWKLYNTLTKTYYKEGSIDVKNNEEKIIDFTNHLKASTTTQIFMRVSGTNHEKDSIELPFTVTSSELKLELPTGFYTTSVFTSSNVSLSCDVTGNVAKRLICYCSDENENLQRIYSRDLRDSETGIQTFNIPSQYATHGHHKIRMELYFIKDDGTIDKNSMQMLQFEIAVIIAGNPKPVIWLGEIKDKYYNYEDIRLYYRLYNPNNTGLDNRVDLKRFGILQTSRTVSGGESVVAGTFDNFEISDASTEQINKYTICFGNEDNPDLYTERTITFRVIVDENKKMDIVATPNLVFNPIGRSNSEPSSSRNQWPKNAAPGTPTAVFENFNWVNNGWMLDEQTNKTALVISNGAKVKIPFGSKVFGGSIQGEEAHTFEIMLKVSNIEKYNNLITNYTRYENDDDLWAEFESQKSNVNGYTNYDSFLQFKLGSGYDDLKYAGVNKVINTNYAIGRYYNSGKGFCIGVQDIFFTSGTNTVNTSFVDDEIINLTLVYSNTLKLLEIYINGMITGVAKSDAFTINSEYLEFDSSLCDIYIYGIRTYNKALTISEIVQNYSVDKKNVDIFDQKNMVEDNKKMNESLLNFNQFLLYYKNHPEKIQMPYIIFDTSANESGSKKLPYSKETDNTIQVEFINAPLDRAYANGELEQLAIDDGLCQKDADPDVRAEAVKFYYKHHSPSWTSTIRDGDKVTISVQGTSSEFYPRRNYKIKTKMKFDNTWNESAGKWDEDENLNIFLHKGPYEEVFYEDQRLLKEDSKYLGKEKSRMADGWYMDNYTNATDRWTMKVDYMESSGSYNAGFANMMGSAYKKHPLQNLIDNNVITNTDKLQPVVEEYTSIAGKDVDITVSKSSLLDANGIKWDDFRTSLQGFPVMAFWKKSDSDYIFIGYYRMLLDKGSSVNTGFKVDKKILHKYVDNAKLRDVVECWEFSTNARTFCSFRDYANRTELSFDPKNYSENSNFTATQAPLVANHFEARYHKDDDALEALMNYSKAPAEKSKDAKYMSIAEINEQYGTNITAWKEEGNNSGRQAASELFLSFHRNWEKACKWVWSTCTDNVCSQNTYSLIKLYEELFVNNKYYIQTTDQSGEVSYSKYTGSYDENMTYYLPTGEKDPDTKKDIYRVIEVTIEADKVYEPYKYYSKVSETAYNLMTGNFDNTLTYYKASEDPTYINKANLLVKKAEGTFNQNEEYYYYDGSKPVNPNEHNGAVIKVENPEASHFNEYYVKNPITYNGITYRYDTKEYRSAKFVNELHKHFNLEYLAVYFVMTEVFECYDSRGKNCMMASWGPEEENGDYIWYPIFYDIDTQLGINNTGIPSFEFNVDATEDKNYSTSDSILWNNFYNYFKTSWILGTYQLLRNENSSISNTPLKKPPLVSVDQIEAWYTFDPKNNNMIACQGERPLIATNLDSYWKYITITNDFLEGHEKSAAQDEDNYYFGRWGYQGQNKDYIIDENGSYFYALQGDRSQARRAFLKNRIDYVDSWLNVGTYKRAGGMQIRGRISANDISGTDISDTWVEDINNPYWTGAEFESEKTNEFDAEYWVELTPVRSSYVAVGDDSAAYPSEKYDPNIGPVKFKLIDLENGIRTSPNYPEQLLYIYGLHNLTDVGDLSKLYWREFFLDGKAPKLTRLKLGHDARDAAGRVWKSKINGLNIYPDGGLPLLKEANFSNITITSNNRSIPLNKSTKLQNFRAVGSNIEEVQFADGVALHTLYLPQSLKKLELIQANQLTTIINEENAPTIGKDSNGNLVAPQGLFIDGFFSNPNKSDLTALHLQGGKLGYHSYRLLQGLYQKGNNDTAIELTLNDVDWCPYERVYNNEAYDENCEYYVNQGHYKFEPYEHISETSFNIQVLNEVIYKKRTMSNTLVNLIGDNTLNIFADFINKDYFRAFRGTAASPSITGIMYINNNSTDIDIDLGNKHYDVLNEAFVADLQEYYPGLQFFFKNIVQSYSAKFIIQDNETGIWEYVDVLSNTSSEKIPSVQKIAEFTEGVRFKNPFTEYSPKKVHYDFKGWSTYPTYEEALSYNDLIVSSDEWDTYGNALLKSDVYDYTYYAIFIPHEYSLRFYNLHDANYGDQIDDKGRRYYETKVTYGTPFQETSYVPYADDSDLELELRNGFKGWTLDETLALNIYDINQNQAVDDAIIDTASYSEIDVDYNLYAVFQVENVYDNIIPYSYFVFDTYTGEDGKTYSRMSINPEKAGALSGKITLPAKDPNGYEIKRLGYFTKQNSDDKECKAIINVTHIFCDKNATYTQIEEEAFKSGSSSNKGLIGIYLPSTISIIKSSAFLQQSNLKDVFNTEGDWSLTNLTNISSQAFRATNGQLHLTKLPNNIKSIDSNAFYRQSKISLNELPASLITLGDNTFNSCDNIGIIEFGKSNSKLTAIPEGCFAGAGNNTNISNVYIYKNIKAIGRGAFAKSVTSKEVVPSNIHLYTEHSANDVNWDAAEIGVAQIHYNWNGVI